MISPKFFNKFVADNNLKEGDWFAYKIGRPIMMFGQYIDLKAESHHPNIYTRSELFSILHSILPRFSEESSTQKEISLMMARDPNFDRKELERLIWRSLLELGLVFYIR